MFPYRCIIVSDIHSHTGVLFYPIYIPIQVYYFFPICVPIQVYYFFRYTFPYRCIIFSDMYSIQVYYVIISYSIYIPTQVCYFSIPYTGCRLNDTETIIDEIEEAYSGCNLGYRPATICSITKKRLFIFLYPPHYVISKMRSWKQDGRRIHSVG